MCGPFKHEIFNIATEHRPLTHAFLICRAALISASFATQIWHLLLSQGICFGMGMGFCFVATVGVVSQWFTTKRSFANSIAAGGSGLGGLTYSLATNAMIDRIGLPWAFRILGILAFVVNGACALVIRDRNKQVGAVYSAFRLDLWKRVEFLLFISWAFFALLAYVVVVFSLADYAQSVGFSASQGSIVAACFSLSQGLGRPPIGLASDRIGRINVAGLCTLIAAISSFFLWIFAGKFYAGLIVYSLFGCFHGSLWATVAPVCAEVIGLQLLPSGNGRPRRGYIYAAYISILTWHCLSPQTQLCPSPGLYLSCQAPFPKPSPWSCASLVGTAISMFSSSPPSSFWAPSSLVGSSTSPFSSYLWR
jgi:MFS family permease